MYFDNTILNCIYSLKVFFSKNYKFGITNPRTAIRTDREDKIIE
jgi:hypothetical protein